VRANLSEEQGAGIGQVGDRLEVRRGVTDYWKKRGKKE